MRKFLRKIFSMDPHLVPWWLGYTFDTPLRRVLHDPVDILGRYIDEVEFTTIEDLEDLKLLHTTRREKTITFDKYILS